MTQTRIENEASFCRSPLASRLAPRFAAFGAFLCTYHTGGEQVAGKSGKEFARDFVIGIAAIAVGMLTTILVMIHGWGLEPKSWLWILGVYWFGQAASLALSRLISD